MVEYDVETLWIGDPADVDDDVWHVVEYEDGSVQFIHTEDHTQIWQDRVTVSEAAGNGRAECHYVETEDVVLFALARNNRAPPQQGLVVEAGRLAGGWSRLTESEQETVLKLLLTEWTNVVAKPLPFELTVNDVTDTIEAMAADDGKPPTTDEVSADEVLRFALDALENGEQRYTS